jgi:hypothetical protein
MIRFGPAMIFLAFWAVLSALAFLFIGIETKGRSIEEIDAALTKPYSSRLWLNSRSGESLQQGEQPPRT